MSNLIEKKYLTITNESELNLVVDYINKYNYIAFDTETTGLNVRKDQVIGFSICGEPGESIYVAHQTWKGDTLTTLIEHKKLIPILQLLSKKNLLTWNGSFDTRIVKNYFGVNLIPALFADGMLLNHTIDENSRMGLKECAIRYKDQLGIDAEREANEEQIALKENIIKNGGSATKSNYEMFKADLEVLAKYAAADADLTFRLCELLNDRLHEEGLEDFFYNKEVMPLYKYVTIIMEDRGIKLDKELILKVYEEIKLKIEEYKSTILKELKKNDSFKKWLNHTLNTNYPISSKGSFAQEYCRHFNLPLPKTESGKYSINKKTLELIKEKYHKDFFTDGISYIDLSNIQLALWARDNGDVININSKTQLGELVFEFMKVKPLSKTETGKPQFDDDFIEHLATQGNNWAKMLSNYNKLVKIKSAYIERFLESEENGYVYFSYKQHGTISGRFGSDAQQLPRPKEAGELDPDVLYFNNLIRTFFIADKDRVFIDCDYESLEPHVFADVSGDDGLRDIFRKGYDFYSTIAIATEKLEGVSADKKADNYLGKVNKPKRQSSKVYSLGVPYGMTDYALGKNLNITTEEAKILLDGYLDGFPNLKKWMEESKLFVKENGYIKSKAGRIRHLPKAKELFIKYKDNLLNFKFRKELTLKLARTHGYKDAAKLVEGMYLDYKNSLNNSLNFQIQSLSASVVNQSAIAINKYFMQNNIDAWVCAQIHDQLIFDVPKHLSEECAKVIKQLMENTIKLSIDLKAPPAIAKNWKDGH